MPDYNRSKNYLLLNSKTRDFYIGSTTMPLQRRLENHRAASKRDLKRYEKFNEIGWEFFTIRLIEYYPCKNVEELRQREQFWIDLLKPSLNNVRAFTTPEQTRQMMLDTRIRYGHSEKGKISIQKHHASEKYKLYQQEYQKRYQRKQK